MSTNRGMLVSGAVSRSALRRTTCCSTRFYQAWSKGELTREDLREYAAEYWHHVSAFPTYLSALHSRLPDAEMRREVLRNLTEEEGVDSATARPHSDLWMDFAAGMGATRVRCKDVRCSRR